MCFKSVVPQKIPFRDIWEGIQRMPNCTFVFSLSDTSVSHFRAKFKARQDCEDGEERDVNVVTSVKQRPSVSFSLNNTFYYMASLVSGQDGPDPAL